MSRPFVEFDVADHWTWIRIGSFLFHAIDNTIPKFFSERYGYKRYYHLPLTSWRIGWSDES